MSSDYCGAVAGGMADEGESTEGAFLEWLDCYTRGEMTDSFHDQLRAGRERERSS